jgi:hypothetical protein
MAPEIAAAAALIRSGAVIAAAEKVIGRMQ